MNRLLLGSLLLLTATFTTHAAPPTSGKLAVEAGRIELLAGSNQKGTVIAYECTTCPIQVTVDEETSFRREGRAVGIEQARRFSGQDGTLVYDPAAKRAVTIKW